MLDKFQRPNDSELKAALRKHEDAVDTASRIIQRHLDGDIDGKKMVTEVAEIADGLNPGDVVHNAVNRVEGSITIPANTVCATSREAYRNISLFIKAKQILLGLFT